MAKEKIEQNISNNKSKLKKPILISATILNSKSKDTFKREPAKSINEKKIKIESQESDSIGYKIVRPVAPKKVKLKNAIEIVNDFITTFRSYRPKITHSKSIDLKSIVETYESDLDMLTLTKQIKTAPEVELSTRDGTTEEEFVFDEENSILIGPQDASEVQLGDSGETWPGSVVNVKNALDVLQEWTTTISSDAEQFKTDLEDISSNIEDALHDISSYGSIGPTSQVSVLRDRVNKLQDLIRNLYEKF